MFSKNKKTKNRFSKKEKPEFDNKIIDIRRTSRMVAGGRRFNFRVTVIIGNRKGKIGIGLGKANDTALAIDKASRKANKNAIDLALTKDFSIPYSVEAKFSSAKVLIRPASRGRGLVAGSSVRTVLDLAGIKGVNAKILSRSKNKLNNAQATIKALAKLK